MAETPNLSELKEAAGSDDVGDAVKYLIKCDKKEEKSFLIRMGEESVQLREVIEKREQTIDEAASFGRANHVANTGHYCLAEIQMKDRRKLDLLAQLLLLTREGLDEKDEHVERIEEAQEPDDE